MTELDQTLVRVLSRFAIWTPCQFGSALEQRTILSVALSKLKKKEREKQRREREHKPWQKESEGKWKGEVRNGGRKEGRKEEQEDHKEKHLLHNCLIPPHTGIWSFLASFILFIK